MPLAATPNMSTTPFGQLLKVRDALTNTVATIGYNARHEDSA
jgi:hypothetical protein